MHIICEMWNLLELLEIPYIWGYKLLAVMSVTLAQYDAMIQFPILRC